ncbi:hypothetical protein CCR87_03180 [Rhodobaculum claviforme]|uniref:Alpha/beta-hydrolase family protein n=1 Tax=Rhodobaculum claviforme TaxID=1549854 RepID=A0A934TJ04_9RHOB|nr:hypothetical protein [Rhodobaculum claviforme]
MLLGTLFFAASLTPSLVPRPTLVQGALGGLSLAAGYGLGVALRAGWLALQLPVARPAVVRRLGWAAALVCAGLAALALWRASVWENRLRALMDMAPVETVGPFTVAAVALVVFAVLLLLARLVVWVARRLSRRLARRLPTPQAVILGVGLTALLFWNIGNGVLIRGAMSVLDGSYQQWDALFEEASPRPTTPDTAGGPGSLLDWEDLGRTGRQMIAAGPDADAIEAVTGGPARRPLRVYVGLNSAPEPEDRAALALAELIRIGGFERAHLVINTPTGTGWIDPAGQQALEYLLRGDVATVAVQYSYLASWIALLADPDYGVESARAVFSAIYGHWRTLPPEERPRLWLHGLSLGALNSDLSHDLFQVIGDPYDGALWVGPPFNSRTWNAVTRARDPGTTAWLPAYRDGAVIRFMGRDGVQRVHRPQAGGYGLVYLQYASDAVVFFDPAAAWRPPAWLQGPRGPDVSPDMRWLPVVTFLQLGMDIMMAVLPPPGHGHTYVRSDYLDAWVELTGAPGWTREGLAQLRARLADVP